MCTATRTSSYSQVGLSVFFIFSLGLYFMCLYCFNYGRMLSDASMLYFADVFLYFF